jgi:hypothetical protein
MDCIPQRYSVCATLSAAAGVVALLLNGRPQLRIRTSSTRSSSAHASVQQTVEARRAEQLMLAGNGSQRPCWACTILVEVPYVDGIPASMYKVSTSNCAGCPLPHPPALGVHTCSR